VTWLACDETCVAGNAVATVSVGVGYDAPGPAMDAIRRARAQEPRSADGIRIAASVASSKFVLRFSGGERIAGAYFFAFDSGQVSPSARQPIVVGENYIELQLTPSEYASTPPERLTGVLALETAGGGRTAYSIDVPLTKH
jgi:DsbC/DsbD-like thiol-disulfide interchange protein